jgi:hypothetical protein
MIAVYRYKGLMSSVMNHNAHLKSAVMLMEVRIRDVTESDGADGAIR